MYNAAKETSPASYRLIVINIHSKKTTFLSYAYENPKTQLKHSSPFGCLAYHIILCPFRSLQIFVFVYFVNEYIWQMDAMQQYSCVLLDILKSKTLLHFMFSFRATLPTSSSHVHFLRIVSARFASLEFLLLLLSFFYSFRSSVLGPFRFALIESPSPVWPVCSKRIYANFWYVSSTLSLYTQCPMVYTILSYI